MKVQIGSTNANELSRPPVLHITAPPRHTTIVPAKSPTTCTNMARLDSSPAPWEWPCVFSSWPELSLDKRCSNAQSTTRPPIAVNTTTRPSTVGGSTKRRAASTTSTPVAIHTMIIMPSAPKTSKRATPKVKRSTFFGRPELFFPSSKVFSSSLSSPTMLKSSFVAYARMVIHKIPMLSAYEKKSESMCAASANSAVDPDISAAIISATAYAPEIANAQ
mmetsp:Transcript_12373/g.46160  ORF Transcript_12373/g.46160 Transcript_12373/m.46160 type:complete len:219 (-) Transcript_12373:526-1182(-)